jgi:uncharacterized coiled-coil protein SlyX
LIPNVEQFGLEKSNSIKQIIDAQDIDSLIAGVNSLCEELGDKQIAALKQAFQQSKKEKVKMAQQGAKLDSLTNKLKDLRRSNQIKTAPINPKELETINKIKELEKQKKEIKYLDKPKPSNDRVYRNELLRRKDVVLAEKGAKCKK